MQCLAGNFYSTSFYNPVECNSGDFNKENDGGEMLSSRCCDFSFDYVQLNVVSAFSFIKVPVPFVSDLGYLFIQQYNIVSRIIFVTDLFSVTTSSPPAVPDVLNLISVLII